MTRALVTMCCLIGGLSLMNGLRWSHLSSRNGDLPTPPGSDQQTLCMVLDIDRDGRNDFVIGCRHKAPSMVWYRRVANGWTTYLIDRGLLPIEAGGAFADIDGDGDLDIVAGEDSQGNRVYWWENPYPVYDPHRPWKRREIKNSGANKHHDQVFDDFDGDGKPELVFFNQGDRKLLLAKIPQDPRVEPWPAATIWSSGGHAEGLGRGDINGDGKIELLAAGRWFKHAGGMDFVPYTIDEAQRNSRIAAGDLNGDGRPEVVMVPGDDVGRLKWYECKDPNNAGAWTGHDLLGFDVKHGHSLAVADFNADGKPDIFCGEMRKWSAGDDNPEAKMWIFFGDGKGKFMKTEVASGYGVHEAKVADLNGDGRPDICAKPYNWETPRMDVWLNLKP